MAKTLGFKSITDDYKQAPAILDIETGKSLCLADIQIYNADRFRSATTEQWYILLVITSLFAMVTTADILIWVNM